MNKDYIQKNTALSVFPQIDNNKIEKLSFKEYTTINLYGNKALSKKLGYNIIKNNDMLQYHYFSQEYGIIKSSHIVSILDININNIIYNIGFLSINCSLLSKTLRSRYFGKHIYVAFRKFYKDNYSRSTNFCTINRTVMMPNFRGLGLNKYFQSKTIEKLDTHYDDIVVLELFSIMLNTFNFMSNEFVNIGIRIKNQKNKDEYFDPNQGKIDTHRGKFIKGFKSNNIKHFAGYAFHIHTKYYKPLSEFYKKFYNIDLDFTKTYEATEDEIMSCFRKGIPLVLFEKSNVSIKELEKKDYTKIGNNSLEKRINNIVT